MEVAGRKVLLVDDQIYTGQSMQTAKEWLEKQGAAEIKTYCVFVQRAKPDFGDRRGVIMYAPWGDDP